MIILILHHLQNLICRSFKFTKINHFCKWPLLIIGHHMHEKFKIQLKCYLWFLATGHIYGPNLYQILRPASGFSDNQKQ